MDNPAMNLPIKILFVNKNGWFFLAFDGKKTWIQVACKLH
jgi:hypothetical protein